MSATDTPAAPAPPVNPNPPPSARRCENCGTPLLGDVCYACGQTTKGLIRRFSTILGDFADTVFNIDARVFRTLGPLLARPGYLSLQYFEGHRVRYVSPVRLFVFLSILAFLAAQWAMHFNLGEGGLRVGGGDDTAIDAATTPAQVIAARDQALAGLAKARKESANVPGVAAGLTAAEVEVRRQADARLRELKAGPRAVGPGDDDEPSITISGGKAWDPKTNPVVIGWLPRLANDQLNAWIGRAKANSKRIKADPDLWKDAFLSVLPQVLFVLLPLFALLLKVVYLFKRRLYMEHLVVALHSHAFLCAVVLLQSLLTLFEDKVASGGVAGFLVGVLRVGLFAWMPLYLLIMQKRVYGQGWVMTFLKYLGVGFAYAILLSFGLAAAMLISLVRM
jgi:hypothetical protein